MGLSYSEEKPTVGQIVNHDGKTYKVTKMTSTAIAVERYFWWDRLYDRFIRRPDEDS
jgi:hypothetical protein